MRLTLLIILSLGPFSWSMASVEIWKTGKSYFKFQRNDYSGLLISKICEKNNCAAKETLKTISFKNLRSDRLNGGKNPGAVLCHELENTQVIFLRDLKGNDNSFCMFPDKSLVSSGSLEMQARKNDEK